MISAISGTAGAYTPQVVSGASMRQPPTQRMSNLFDKIDTSGSGSITKAQFTQAFQSLTPPKGLQSMGADAIFSQLDPNNTGSVSKQDFVNGMTKILAQLRSAHAGARADRDGDHDGSVSNQTNSASSGADLSAALQSLEATLGNSSSTATSGTAGNLFNAKA